jgi:hypothetical protein
MSELREKNLMLLPARVIRKILRDPRESLLLIRMGGWVLLLSSLIKIQTLPRAMQLISTRVRESSLDEQETGLRLAQAADLLLTMNVFVYRPSCWKRAAILHRYLALHGIESRINFGMRKELDGTLGGHAWLEKAGAPLLEETPPNYTVTFSFPTADNNCLHTPLET